MSHPPRCLWIASLVFALGGNLGGQEHSAPDEPLTFDVRVVPEDPFHPLNQIGNTVEPMKIRRGQVVRLVIEAKLKPGFHTYPLMTRTAWQHPAKVWKYTLEDTPGLAPLGPVMETEPVRAEELGEGKRRIKVLEHKSDFTWAHDVLILPDAKAGPLVLPIRLRGQVCDDKSCLIKQIGLKATFNVSVEDPVPVETAVAARRIKEAPPPSIVTIPGEPSPPAAVDPDRPSALASGPPKHQGELIFSPLGGSAETYRAEMEALAAKIRMSDTGAGPTSSAADLWAFIAAGIFWGFVSLITPCVFPMIPITVSFFLKQSEREHHRPFAMALVYSGTIVVVLTLAAAFLLSVFRWLSINPVMNYGLGALFIFFALSLFGMYEIELPSGLARYTSAHEGQGGFVGTMFMALTFTIISFACVAPFLGGFGGTAAGTARPWWHNILGGLAFSLTFAAPFFLLALFPTLLRRMPKSGNWLNSVKVVMGFLELAAAFKFFRSAELVLTGSEPWLFTFDFVMGIYVTLCFLCGLYLLGVYRLPHDTPEEHLGVPRMLFAGLFLALGFYLLPALFKTNGESQRPTGAIYAWVDSFLLPEANSGAQEPHTANLPAAVAAAREHRQKTGEPKRIFVDFTGVTCTNCSINEHNVFIKPEIRKLFAPYTQVKMYNDMVPKLYYNAEVQAELAQNGERQETDAEVNLAFQKKVFNTEQLPLYVILEPQLEDTILVVSVYPEGRINNEAAFAEFLREPK
jgi:thiol:disulfide interchange protein